MMQWRCLSPVTGSHPQAQPSFQISAIIDRSAMRNVVWITVVLLAVLHQDAWFWADTSMILGFIPVGLFYHAMFSLACGAVWALAVKFSWPEHLEAWADEFEGPAPIRKMGVR